MKLRSIILGALASSLLMMVLSACDDQTTAFVVIYDSQQTSDDNPFIRVVVTAPDGAINSSVIGPGGSITVKSIYEGNFLVSATSDDSNVQKYRKMRDDLILKLAEADVLGVEMTAEKRAEINQELDTLIEKVNDLSDAASGKTCFVEQGEVGGATIGYSDRPTIGCS